MHKFVKGDIVRIKPKFWEIEPTNLLAVMSSMYKYADNVYTIQSIYNSGVRWYRLEEVDFIWDENWLEPAGLIKDVYTEELDLLFMGD